MITIHGQLTEQDYLHAQRLHLQSANWTRFLPLATIIIWAIGVIFMLTYALLSNAIPYGVMLSISLGFLALVIPFTSRIILPRQVNRLFHQNKELSAPMELEFDEVGMRLTNRYGETRRAWTDFFRWKEDEQCILLYPSEATFHAIPKRFFDVPAEAQFVREQLEIHDVPVAGAPKQVVLIQIMMFALIVFTVTTLIFAALS